MQKRCSSPTQDLSITHALLANSVKLVSVIQTHPGVVSPSTYVRAPPEDPPPPSTRHQTAHLQQRHGCMHEGILVGLHLWGPWMKTSSDPPPHPPYSQNNCRDTINDSPLT